MTPHERDRLRAGWLTSSLAPDERERLLLEAAADQALFDELMDAEPLRELLAEPETRAEALRRLRTAAPAVSVPWWRQHWSWAGAGALALAGLFLMVVLPTWRSQKTDSPVQIAARRQEAPPPAAAPVSAAPQKPKAQPPPAPRLALRDERAANIAGEMKATSTVESDALKEREGKEERAAVRARLGGAPGGVVGGIIGGVPAPAAPPAPAEAAAPVFRAAESTVNQPQTPQPERERFGQRAASGPMQQQAYQAVTERRKDEQGARKELSDAGLAAASESAKGGGGAGTLKATLGLRQPDGTIRPLAGDEAIERGAALALTIESAEQARIEVSGLPRETARSRRLEAGEKWVIDIPTGERGARTLRISAGPVPATPVAGFAGTSRRTAPLSVTYRVR